MKLRFNKIVSIYLPLLFCFSLQAKDIVLLTYQKRNQSLANKVLSIVTNQFHIPKRFIKNIVQKSPCFDQANAIFHFCINENKELLVLKKDPEFYNRNLKVFRKKDFINLGE